MNQGYSEATIQNRGKLLKRLVRLGANLYDPESVKSVIAKERWCPGRKANFCDAYDTFLQMLDGKWEKPFYQAIEKPRFVPQPREVDDLIAALSPRMATFCQLLKETGIRSGEAWVLKWDDIDLVSKVIRVTPEKRSKPRQPHISPKLAAMLEALPRNYGDRVFSRPEQPVDHHRDHFLQQRKRIAHEQQNSRLVRITFHTIRHFAITMRYHKGKDILDTAEFAGHKNLENTRHYVKLAEELFKDQQEYVSKVAKTQTDACSLIDAGFEFVCDFDGAKIFRKQKYDQIPWQGQHCHSHPTRVFP